MTRDAVPNVQHLFLFRPTVVDVKNEAWYSWYIPTQLEMEERVYAA